MTNTTQQLIMAVEQADSANGLLDAVNALIEIPDTEAIPTLITILGYNNPGAAVAAVDGLIAIGEPAVPFLLQQIDDYNYGARAWAIRALAGIGDPSALKLLLDTAINDFAFSVRRSAAKGLGNIIWSKVPATEVQQQQKEVLKTLFLACEDVEWIVRYAAVVGLEKLAITLDHSLEDIQSQIQQKLNTETDLTVKARMRMALEAIHIKAD